MTDKTLRRGGMSAFRMVALTACVAIVCACAATSAPPAPTTTAPATFAPTSTPFVATNQFTPISAEDQLRAMGRGVNVLGYDPIWRDPAQARFHERHMQIIH